MDKFRLFFSALAISGFLTGCGGGGGESITTYTGSTSQATLTTSNAPSYTKAATEAAEDSLTSDSLQTALPKSSKILAVHNKSLDIIRYQTIPGVCDSGSVDVTGNESSGVITYNNCTIILYPDTFTINGRASYTYSSDLTSFSVTYSNFSITYNGITETIENMTISCTNSGMTCSISADFTASDGRVYRAVNYQVTGSYPNFTISGRLYHPDHGYTDISGSVTYGTCSGVDRPISGSITITGSNGTASVTFNDCNSFTVTLDGVPTVVNW